MGTGNPNNQRPGTGGGVHPDARAGGGGPGYFRDASPVLGDDTGQGTVRHARSPANRLRVASAGGPASGGRSRKDPPKTVPMSKRIASQSGAEANIDVRVRVLPDKKGSRRVPVHAGKTSVMPSSGLQTIAGMSWTTTPDGKIKRVTKKLVVRGTFEIQTSYGTKADPKQDSLYGRGTTPQDKAAGNVTLGFHEWCHQQEYLQYLLHTAFPAFGGRVDMAEEDFKAEIEKFNTKFETFSRDLVALGDAVDEVGYKKSRCIADGRC